MLFCSSPEAALRTSRTFCDPPLATTPTTTRSQLGGSIKQLIDVVKQNLEKSPIPHNWRHRGNSFQWGRLGKTCLILDKYLGRSRSPASAPGSRIRVCTGPFVQHFARTQSGQTQENCDSCVRHGCDPLAGSIGHVRRRPGYRLRQAPHEFNEPARVRIEVVEVPATP